MISPDLQQNIDQKQFNGESLVVSQVMSEVCRRQSNIVVGADIAESPKGSNIFLGVGLVTNQRISSGLGFGTIPMACLARDIQIGFREKWLDSTITVLIADQHGLNEEMNPQSGKQISFAADTVHGSCEKLFKFIDSPQTQIVKASNPNWPTGKHSYTEMETADILHAHENLGCGIKIGWQSKREPKDGRSIRDEKWFDNQAIEHTGNRLHRMSFIRTGEWMSLATQIDPATLPERSRQVIFRTISIPYQGEAIIRSERDVNTSPHNLPLPPYFGETGFHLGQDINLMEKIRNGEITRVMLAQLAVFDSVLKRVLNIRVKTGRLEILQELINSCVI